MAGYGLPENEHLSFQLERDLEVYYTLDTNVINGSVSGDTSSSGLNRLEWTLPDKIDLVILCLGANDMLRGLIPLTNTAHGIQHITHSTYHVAYGI